LLAAAAEAVAAEAEEEEEEEEGDTRGCAHTRTPTTTRKKAHLVFVNREAVLDLQARGGLVVVGVPTVPQADVVVSESRGWWWCRGGDDDDDDNDDNDDDNSNNDDDRRFQRQRRARRSGVVGSFTPRWHAECCTHLPVARVGGANEYGVSAIQARRRGGDGNGATAPSFSSFSSPPPSDSDSYSNDSYNSYDSSDPYSPSFSYSSLRGQVVRLAEALPLSAFGEKK
jgi:hypothetical protein